MKSPWKLQKKRRFKPEKIAAAKVYFAGLGQEYFTHRADWLIAFTRHAHSEGAHWQWAIRWALENWIGSSECSSLEKCAVYALRDTERAKTWAYCCCIDPKERGERIDCYNNLQEELEWLISDLRREQANTRGVW